MVVKSNKFDPTRNIVGSNLFDFNLKELYTAYYQCRRHKRRTLNAQHYELDLLNNLYTTLQALQQRTYCPKRAIRFVAQKPKAREIHAADFSDRVVHHYLVPQLEKLFEPIFINDVYSNRLNKGTHKAINRLQAFMHAVGYQGYYLQLDIANFFNSIDKPILFKLIQQRLRKALKQHKISNKQANTLRWLVQVLLRHDAAKNSIYRGDPKLLQRVPAHKQLGYAGQYKGLPIGNLTSQFFANVYLNELDQFIKHKLKCRYYVRYVDDFVLLASSAEQLMQWREDIIIFLQQQLQLKLKELAVAKPIKSGADFLGYIIYPHYRLVRRRVIGNLRERLNFFQTQLMKGSVQYGYKVIVNTELLAQLRAVIARYWGHFQHANSQQLCRAFFVKYPWLALLFDAQLQPRYQPNDKQIIGYKSQLNFFHRHYPLAQLRVQRGIEQDIRRLKSPLQTLACKGYFNRPYNEPPLWVTRVIIHEQGYLKNALKRRVATLLFIQAGVELCPIKTNCY
ncbi:MAG: RNA-directed DNA polymerase [Methylococcaceae bacterium]